MLHKKLYPVGLTPTGFLLYSGLTNAGELISAAHDDEDGLHIRKQNLKIPKITVSTNRILTLFRKYIVMSGNYDIMVV